MSSSTCSRRCSPCGTDILAESGSPSTGMNCYQNQTPSARLLPSSPYYMSVSTSWNWENAILKYNLPGSNRTRSNNCFRPEKNGSSCFCVKYRNINNLTQLDSYPIPGMGMSALTPSVKQRRTQHSKTTGDIGKWTLKTMTEIRLRLHITTAFIVLCIWSFV